jgi:hypothetical protein
MCRVEEGIGVRESFGAARIGRVSVENVVVETKENTQGVFFALG